MTAVVVALGLVVLVLAVLVVGLLRSHAEILKRLHDLGAGIDSSVPAARVAAETGTEAHDHGPQPGSDFQVMPQMPSPPDRVGFGGSADIAGVNAAGNETVTVRVAEVEHDTIVAFLSSGCLTCQKFWDAFRKPRKLGLPANTRIVVVTKGPHEESPSAVAQLAPPGIPTVMSSQAFTDYDIPGSPYFVQVHGPTGRVRGEGTGPDWDQVSGLLSQASGDAALNTALAGSQVPKPDADAEREARIDSELYAAGVAPGDPSLYSVDDAERAADEESAEGPGTPGTDPR